MTNVTIFWDENEGDNAKATIPLPISHPNSDAAFNFDQFIHRVFGAQVTIVKVTECGIDKLIAIPTARITQIQMDLPETKE